MASFEAVGGQGGSIVRSRPAPLDPASLPRPEARPKSVLEALSRSFVSTGGVLVASSRFPPGQYKPASRGHLLALRPSGPHRRVWLVEGRTLEGTANADDIGVVPAGQPVTFEVLETTEALSVAVREDFVGRIAEGAGADPARLEVPGGLSVYDPVLAHIVRSFVPEMGGGGLGGELYAEALATQLAVHLLRRHSSLGRRGARELDRVPSGPFPNRAISRAVNRIHDDLAGKLHLEELAGAAGYSPHHFARLFKEATGLPPHRYVLRERVRRARGLLENTELPMAEVAQMCGFSNQSHMGRAVKALTGATPARLRREARR